MSMHKMLLALFSALVLGAMVAPQANASLKYAAKFVCGAVPFEPPPINKPPIFGTPTGLPTEVDAVVGVYLTSVNIHNPQNTTVTFDKKVVQAFEEPPPGVPLPPLKKGEISNETLSADAAEFVDCAVIYRLLNYSPPLPHIEGFVVLTIPEDPNTGAFNFLDVVGKYTARSPDIGTYSPALEIVVYSPTIIQ